MKHEHIDYCARQIREMVVKADEYGRAVLMETAASHIHFFQMEGLVVDRLKFLEDCGLMEVAPTTPKKKK
jgi:hypothetical protein